MSAPSCDPDAGGCVDQAIQDCAPYNCYLGVCATQCQSHADCVAAAWCDDQTCRPDFAPGQACTLDEQCPDGYCTGGVCCEQAGCGDFACGANGICLLACSASSDCVSGYRCNARQQCVRDYQNMRVSGPGCGCRLVDTRAERPAGSMSGWLGLLVLMCYRARRGGLPRRRSVGGSTR